MNNRSNFWGNFNGLGPWGLFDMHGFNSTFLSTR